MWKLLPYLKGYKKESIIGPLFKLLEACFELIVPIIMAHIIDIGIRNKDIHYIMVMGSILVGLGILGLTCSLTAQYYAAKAAVGFGTVLRCDMFRHIQGISYTGIDQVGSATLVVRMTSDINQVQSGVNLVLRLFLRSPFIVVGAMIMAFTINAKASMIFLIAVPVLALVIYGVMMITIPLYKKVQKGLDRIMLTTKENLTGIRVIRAFGMQEKEQQQFETESNCLLDTQLLVGRLSALMNPITFIIVNIGIVAVVWYGGIQVDTGKMTQGEVIALVSYMTQILLALVALAMLIVSFTKALASAGRINEVFARSSEIKDGSLDIDCRDTELVMEGVGFTYQGNIEPTLSNIGLRAKQGDTIGIIGGTGSGKTTLVQLIPRFYNITEGRYALNDKSIEEWKIKSLRNVIGIVPQKAVLFQGTIRKNMQISAPDATDEEICSALSIAQGMDLVNNKSEGLDYVISENGKNLSGGQRQRLTIARALVRSPKILILDDSASALDYATDAKLRKSIKDNCRDMIVFIVSQRASSIMHADQIVVLEDGHMAGYGTHEMLKESCEVYQEILNSQLTDREDTQYA